jgi:hypothetical protein
MGNYLFDRRDRDDIIGKNSPYTFHDNHELRQNYFEVNELIMRVMDFYLLNNKADKDFDPASCIKTINSIVEVYKKDPVEASKLWDKYEHNYAFHPPAIDDFVFLATKLRKDDESLTDSLNRFSEAYTACKNNKYEIIEGLSPIYQDILIDLINFRKQLPEN